MIRNSVKQILRKPGKALIFFLLITAATALLTFSAVSMAGTCQRIAAAESQFTTIATVTQVPEPGADILSADMLDFPGADYLAAPETRPTLFAYNPELFSTDCLTSGDSIHIVEFTPLEDCLGLNQEVKIKVEEVHCNRVDSYRSYMKLDDEPLSSGDTVRLMQLFEPFVPLETGKTYIANLTYIQGQQLGLPNGYVPYFNPYSADFDGPQTRLDQVTDGFWESGKGRAWLEWAAIHRRESALQTIRHTGCLPVCLTHSLDQLPAFHSRDVYLSEGRAITPEEFASGAKVCILPQTLMNLNGLAVGDKISLAMVCAVEGFTPEFFETFHFNPGFTYSALNPETSAAQAFFQAEYEIVGEYARAKESFDELYYDMILAPTASVPGWEEHVAYSAPMNRWSTSFQIPNGEILAFDAALHAAAPQASQLQIVYDDNGYEDVVQGLNHTRLSAALLLAAGAFSALSIIVLLLYFFVVRERKRTAIERSLGMSKTRCRISLLAGIMALALPAAAAGSGLGWLTMNNVPSPTAEEPVQEEVIIGEMALTGTAHFYRNYSLWAENEHSDGDILLDDTALAVQNMIYIAVPLGILLAIAGLAAALTNQNLKIEPIMLLGGKGE